MGVDYEKFDIKKVVYTSGSGPAPVLGEESTGWRLGFEL
jgi:hypothetical protein